MMISAKVIETSVTITDYLQSQLLRSTLTWKIKLSSPKVLLCWNYSLFNTNHNVHVRANKSICESFPFTLQNNLLIAFSLCHSSAEDK